MCCKYNLLLILLTEGVYLLLKTINYISIHLATFYTLTNLKSISKANKSITLNAIYIVISIVVLILNTVLIVIAHVF